LLLVPLLLFIGLEENVNNNKSYQQLKNLESQFTNLINESQIEHFHDAKYLLKLNKFTQLQKKFINKFNPECEKLKKELTAINKKKIKN